MNAEAEVEGLKVDNELLQLLKSMETRKRHRHGSVATTKVDVIGEVLN